MSAKSQTILSNFMNMLLEGGFNGLYSRSLLWLIIALIEATKKDLISERDVVTGDEISRFFKFVAFSLTYLCLVLRQPHVHITGYH